MNLRTQRDFSCKSTGTEKKVHAHKLSNSSNKNQIARDRFFGLYL